VARRGSARSWFPLFSCWGCWVNVPEQPHRRLLQFCREQERSRGKTNERTTSVGEQSAREDERTNERPSKTIIKRAQTSKARACVRDEWKAGVQALVTQQNRTDGRTKKRNWLEEENKLARVRGGCLGAEGRRRTRRPAKRSGGAAYKR